MRNVLVIKHKEQFCLLCVIINKVNNHSELTGGYNCVLLSLFFHPGSFKNIVIFYAKCMNEMHNID